MASRGLIVLATIPLLAAVAACGDDDDPADTGDTTGTGAASGTGALGSGASTGSGAEGGAPGAGGAGATGGGTGASGGAAPMTCDEVSAAYDALVGPDHQTCEPTEMCQVLQGHCAQGLGGCFHVVNSSVTQADLDALLEQWLALGCTAGVCDCPSPPIGATCQQGMCVGHE